MVVKDISQHYHQWGTRRFWFTDAQFITGKEAYPQCTEIMERIISEKLEIEWSGYIRTSLITPDFAKLMVRSGVGDLEVAITSGSQEVLNNLHMGFKLERLYDGCRYLAEAGFKGRVILNYSLNSPKETEDTLLQSVESYKVVASILGEERVFPLMFFLGIQPNTDLEQRLLEEGYLSAGYFSGNALAEGWRKPGVRSVEFARQYRPRCRGDGQFHPRGLQCGRRRGWRGGWIPRQH